MNIQYTRFFLILLAFIVCISFTGGCSKEPADEPKSAPPSSASVQVTNQPTIKLDTVAQTAKLNDSKSEFDGLKGLKIERIDEKTVRIIEGFDYQRDIELGSPQTTRIEDIIGGTIMMPEAGSVSIPGAQTAVGMTWVFTKEGMTLNRGGFNYTSMAKDASVEFTKQGVVLKSFKIENSH